jgi:hypothetical protein
MLALLEIQVNLITLEKKIVVLLLIFVHSVWMVPLMVELILVTNVPLTAEEENSLSQEVVSVKIAQELVLVVNLIMLVLVSNVLDAPRHTTWKTVNANAQSIKVGGNSQTLKIRITRNVEDAQPHIAPIVLLTLSLKPQVRSVSLASVDSGSRFPKISMKMTLQPTQFVSRRELTMATNQDSTTTSMREISFLATRVAKNVNILPIIAQFVTPLICCLLTFRR